MLPKEKYKKKVHILCPIKPEYGANICNRNKNNNKKT